MWDEGQGKASQWGKGLKGKGHERGLQTGAEGRGGEGEVPQDCAQQQAACVARMSIVCAGYTQCRSPLRGVEWR
jgi:hypothetical protein